jgi:hypothetical protein
VKGVERSMSRSRREEAERWRKTHYSQNGLL